jgi:glycosyltransferase involved in cell wall biosynthesis
VKVTVGIPTHNPNAVRLRRTLMGLRAQTLPADQWDAVLVDNASTPAVETSGLREVAPSTLRVVRESQLGLTAARRCGLAAASAPLIVLVDDDNVLAPAYLAQVVHLFAVHPRLGAAGGRSLPEFEREPHAWQREFLPLLALRDLGETPQISEGLKFAETALPHYPVFAPIGAGMALRRQACTSWLTEESGGLPDRRGRELSSAGDNEIVFSVLEAGWQVAYFPELYLAHLIPAARLEPEYLARLNRGIQESWMRGLTKHGANPWPPIARWTVPLRKLKSWFVHRAWSSPAAQIRWQGVCGHFDGRVSSPA